MSRWFVLVLVILLGLFATQVYAAPFTDNGNGTVTDTKTGLIWQQGEPGYMTWDSALSYCEGLSLGGHSDWRLPNIKELESITDDTKYNPAIDIAFFPNAYASSYWSSTTGAYGPDGAWVVYFYGGGVSYDDKYGSYYVRCVRGGQSGSFGDLDHFDFSFISSPQSIGVPFSITMTARDANGNVVNYNGSISLWSNGGAVYPTTVYLTNGTWTDIVSISEAGIGVYLNASGSGSYGTSNTFSVNSTGSDIGKLAGTVRDNRDNLLSGAKVYLDSNNDGIPEYEETTNSEGVYQFSNNIPAGSYVAWADYYVNGHYKSPDYPVYIPVDRSVTQDLSVILFSSGKTPVILVPGIMGTSVNYSDNIIPLLPEKCPALASKLVLHDPFFKAGWRDLIAKLEKKGYERDQTIIGAGYDWRLSAENVVKEYLIPAIDHAKQVTGSAKVNIVAHSTGGLVVRSYIQSDDYRNDIDKFAMVATPNLGAVNAYYIWEGGDPKWADDLNDSFWESPWAPAVNFYWRTTQKMYEKTYKLGGLSSNQNKTIQDFIQNKAPELRDLLPTFKFLEYNSSLRGITSSNNENKTLINLNNNAKRFERMSGTGGADVVKTNVFYSFSEDTIKSHRILNPDWPRSSSLYEDGIPQPYGNPIKSKGDGTVVEESAKSPCVEGWAHCNSGTGKHSGLIGEFADMIVSFIDEGELVFSNQALKSQNLFSSAEPKIFISSTDTTNVLSLSINGRVQPYLINPDGQGSGINNISGFMENDIPGAKVLIGVDAGSISIDNATDGTYTIHLKGIYNEDFSLSIGYMDAEKIVIRDYRGFNHSNTISFTFTVNSGSVDKITINHTPLPPTGLQADAVISGGLQTRLTWDLNSDPDVTGYNVYSKYFDEPYLSQLGSSTSNFFDTGHSWAENSSIKTRIYAVSAVKADGTESFLSDMVQNNDRDHDGLTDEQEALYGTAVNNPDTDGDGLKDGEEYVRGTNPLVVDTDGDGHSDYVEIQAGSDPLDMNSIPCTTPPSKPTLINPPDGASNVSITPTLDWGDVSGATSYNVQICSDSNCSSVVKSLNVTNSQRTISSALNLGTTYYWRVRAKNSCGSSSWSSVWSFTTFFVKPPSQLNVKAISSTQIVLSWIDNSDNELGFKIERKEGACDSANIWKQIAKKGSNVTTHTNTGLTPNTTYSYQVRAYNADDDSAYSNCASAKTALSGTSKAPTNLKATSVSSSKVNLSWKDNSLDETSFKVYRKVGTGSWTLLTTTDVDAVSYSDTTAGGNTSTTSYSYYVKACNGSGCSPATNIAVVPYSPLNLVVEASAGKVDLTWEDKSGNESGFQIYRKSGACSSTKSWGLITTTGPNITSYNNTGLSSGKTYSYKVRAYKISSAQPYAYGYSMFSNCSSAITP